MAENEHEMSDDERERDAARERLAQAWDEGVDAGWHVVAADGPHDVKGTNPYRGGKPAPLSAEELREIGDYARGLTRWGHFSGQPLARLHREHAALGQRVAELEREVGLLRAVARDAAAYARSKHASYWQQTSASLEALEAFDAQRAAAKGGA